MQQLTQITDTMSKTEASEAVLKNWNIVLEENARELHLVTDTQRQTWESYRDSVNRGIDTTMRQDNLDAIYTHLMELNKSINGAQRENLSEKHRIEQQAEQESVGALRGLWNKITGRDKDALAAPGDCAEPQCTCDTPHGMS